MSINLACSGATPILAHAYCLSSCIVNTFSDSLVVVQIPTLVNLNCRSPVDTNTSPSILPHSLHCKQPGTLYQISSTQSSELSNVRECEGTGGKGLEGRMLAAAVAHGEPAPALVTRQEQQTELGSPPPETERHTQMATNEQFIYCNQRTVCAHQVTRRTDTHGYDTDGYERALATSATESPGFTRGLPAPRLGDHRVRTW